MIIIKKRKEKIIKKSEEIKKRFLKEDILLRTDIITLNEFKSEISVRLGTIYAVSEEVVNEQLEHPESICLSCLYDLGRKNKVHIDMLDYGNSTIFKVIDDNSRLNNESYGWSFAVK